MVAAPTQVEIFCSYAHEDEVWLRKLETHLSLLKRQGLVCLWYDRLIVPGTDWAKTIDTHLETASVILLLVSADFFASNYCYGIEMKRALERQNAGEARVVPIVVRSVDWKDAPFAHLQALPTDAKPLASWQDEDTALVDVVAGIRQAIKDLTSPDVSTPHPSVRVPHPSSLQTIPQQHALIVRMLHQEYDKRLAQSLQGAAMMVLGLHERTDIIRSSAQLIFQRTQIEREAPLPADTSIAQAYDDAGQGLLILGAPGAGKTTLLLDLARELLTRAEENSTHPIPVILNLSSWASKRSPLPPWISDQLRIVYGIPSRLGQTLLEQDHWLVLLDGLDEVEASARNACIEAINQYREEHFVPLVVCSRSQEYVKEQAQLTLSSAVEIQPLQEQEVTEHLKRLGKSMAVVHAVLQTNPVLKQLLTTPLMLNVVILAYRDKSLKDIPKIGSAEEQQRRIFEHYVERMLERHLTHGQFTSQQTRSYLIWLAQQMQRCRYTEFYLEWLQPTWLPTKWSQTYYCKLVFDPLFLPRNFFCFWMALWTGFFFSPGYGLFVGLSLFSIALCPPILPKGWLRKVGIPEGELKKIKPTEILTWSWKRFWRGLVFGLVIGPVLVAFQYVAIQYAKQHNPDLVVAVVQYVTRHQTLISFHLDFRTSDFRSALVAGLLSCLLVGPTLGLISGLSSEQINDDIRIRPNQGISISGWTALRLGLSVGLLTGLLAGLVTELIDRQASGLLIGLFGGSLFGPLVGISVGGTAYVQHYVLRYLLYRCGVIPWHYIRFLEEATERILLQRVGGGYRFIHPLFQEYFASQGAEAVPRFHSQVSQ